MEENANHVASPHQLSEVAVEYALEPLEVAEGFKDQLHVKHLRTLTSIPGQAAEAETQNRLQSPDDPSSSELSPTSVTQSIPSISSPTPQEQKSSPIENRVLACVPETENQNSVDCVPLSVVPVLKRPSPDGYNWRKYGQKQVKSPQGSRSYYRCTYSDCCAKKIECSDHTNRVIEIVYKSQHNHNPTRKVSCSPESRLASSDTTINGHKSTVHSATVPNDSVPFNSSKDIVQELSPASETKERNIGGSNENTEINVEENIDEPESKKRQKRTISDCSETQTKPGKKPKFVVHAAGDVGISGDGYRWRKYGQKMVKGNPHPRNYYRCTSAGCPVRKHIESAVDNTNAVIITYKGMHDHDMPVPKKRQSLPSAPLVAPAAAPASLSNSQVQKSEEMQNQISTTKWSVDKEGELTGETLEVGGEKAVGSARTLLSIGFEIKPC